MHTHIILVKKVRKKTTRATTVNYNCDFGKPNSYKRYKKQYFRYSKLIVFLILSLI